MFCTENPSKTSKNAEFKNKGRSKNERTEKHFQ